MLKIWYSIWLYDRNANLVDTGNKIFLVADKTAIE